MHPVTGIAMYLVIWWVVLFAVLPWGVRPVPGPDAATGWRGAPARVRVGVVVLATSVVAGVVWGICYLAITTDLLSFRSGWLAMPTN